MSDHSDIAKLEKRLVQSAAKLQGMANSLGMARQVREFASDRRKSALAVEMVKAMRSDKVSAAAAEAIARASDGFLRAMEEQEGQFRDAETVIAQHAAEVASFDACRSLLAMNRESVRRFDG